MVPISWQIKAKNKTRTKNVHEKGCRSFMILTFLDFHSKHKSGLILVEL